MMLSDVELLIRLGAAALCGALIGFERERLLWAAGLRTHMLVCVASCLVMIVSAFGFADVLGSSNVVLDPSRIAAQVVSGIGFLGAGAILLRGEFVRGLTTAASVWTVAAIGLAVGAGLYVAAGATTALVLIILAGLKPLEQRFRDRQRPHILRLSVRPGEVSTDVLKTIAGIHSRWVRQFVVEPRDAETETVTIAFGALPHGALDEIIRRLRELPGMISVETERNW